MVAVPASVLAAISSWSRGALLTLGVLMIVLLWHSRRKYLIVPIVVAGTMYLLPMLPQAWYARMHTIETYQQDASAMARIQAWTDGFNWALSHPFGGSGFEGWHYVTISDWHSSYIEIMAEHGFIAFGMWFSLLVGTIISLTRLARKAANRPDLVWIRNYSYMLRASLIAYMAGTVFLGLSYWDIFYHLVFISVLTKKFALEELERSPALSELEKHGNIRIKGRMSRSPA
jgi:probable O-glycosylation ligase (exosortase A-associated)